MRYFFVAFALGDRLPGDGRFSSDWTARADADGRVRLGGLPPNASLVASVPAPGRLPPHKYVLIATGLHFVFTNLLVVDLP